MQTTLADEVEKGSNPSKALQEQEKQLLNTMKVCFMFPRTYLSTPLNFHIGSLGLSTHSCFFHLTLVFIYYNDSAKYKKDSLQLRHYCLQDVLQKFVTDSAKLQMHCLYAAQVFCYNHAFPKGILCFSKIYK